MSRRRMMRMARMQGAWLNYAPNTVERARFGRRVVVHDWERAVAFRDGVATGVLGPGAYRYWTRVTYRRVDMRPWVLHVPTQEVPTVDGIAVKVSVAAIARVVDPTAAFVGAQDASEAVYLVMQVAVREVFAAATIDDVLTQRAALAERVAEHIGDVSTTGIALERVELKDIVLPGELKRAQAQALVAKAEGAAALERARAETATLRNLANAARLVAEAPALLDLRLLQELGRTTGHTIVIGRPTP